MNPASIKGARVELEDLVRLRLATMAAEREAFDARLGASGARLSRFRGRGIEFTEVRAYQPGDDVRSIDWKVTARRAMPHTKIYQEERERPELIVVDQTRGMFFGTGVRLKSVTAAETSALLAWQYLRRGDRVGGIVLGEQEQVLIRPKRRIGATLRLLRAVHTANQFLRTDIEGAPPSLANTLQDALRLAPTGHGVHILSDFGEPIDRLKPPLARLAHGNDVRLIFIYDTFEATPPVGRYPLSSRGERLTFDTTRPHTRARVAERFGNRLLELQRLCQSVGCRLLELPNQSSLLDGNARAA